jgi:hypothetical protein
MATLEVRLARSHHPNRLRLRQRFALERTEPCANAAARKRVAREGIYSYGQGLRRSLQLNFFFEMCPGKNRTRGVPLLV